MICEGSLVESGDVVGEDATIVIPVVDLFVMSAAGVMTSLSVSSLDHGEPGPV